MKIHNLKSLPDYFRAVWNGQKNFEIRVNDRDFKEGDFVILQEWSESNVETWQRMYMETTQEWGHTGEIIIARITYVTNFEQKDGHVVFGIRVLERKSLTRGDDPLSTVSSTKDSYPCR